MTPETHYVSGFFEHSNEAKDVFSKLIDEGLPNDRVKIYRSHSPESLHEPQESSNQVLKEVLVDGAIGTAVGTGVGALIQVAVVATNLSLFIASPLVAPLIIMGWTASLGGFIGATVGAAENSKSLGALIEDAIKNGQIVVVAETQNETETTIAQNIIKSSIGDYLQVNAA